jgi:hypothetical protein
MRAPPPPPTPSPQPHPNLASLPPSPAHPRPTRPTWPAPPTKVDPLGLVLSNRHRHQRIQLPRRQAIQALPCTRRWRQSWSGLSWSGFVRSDFRPPDKRPSIFFSVPASPEQVARDVRSAASKGQICPVTGLCEVPCCHALAGGGSDAAGGGRPRGAGPAQQGDHHGQCLAIRAFGNVVSLRRRGHDQSVRIGAIRGPIRAAHARGKKKRVFKTTACVW